MKIVIDAWRLGMEAGTSGAIYIDNLINVLSEDCDNEIHLIVANSIDNSYADNVKIIEVKYASDLKRRFRYQFFWVQRYVRREVEKLTPDIFISPYHHPIMFCKVKQMTILHDLCGLGRDYKKTDKYYWRHLAMLTITGLFSNKIVPISRFTAASFKKSFPAFSHKMTEVLYNSININPQDRLASGEKDINKIMCFAAPGTRKGFDISIDFFQSLSKIYKAHLIIKTSEAFKPEATDFAKSRLKSDSFSIVGALSDEEMAELYHDIDFLLFPSRCEGFGYPVLESIANGVPVICSKGTPAEEILAFSQPIAESLLVEDMLEQFRKIQGVDKGDLAIRLKARSNDFNYASYKKLLKKVIEEYGN